MPDPKAIQNLQELLRDNLPAPNDYTKEIGRLIKVAREENGLTQKELAERVYRSQVTISDIENGKIEPTLLILFILCWVLGKSISYFIPDDLIKQFAAEAKTPQEEEALKRMHEIFSPRLQTLVVEHIKLIAELDEWDREVAENPFKALE